MPNIASILKPEISRIARKEVKVETESLKKSSVTYRAEIAALKRRAKTLEDQLRQLSKAANRAPKETPVVERTPATTVRFSATRLASQRQRLQLSAEQLALLIGVSGQSVYNWEREASTPHTKYFPAIAALKTLTVRQAAEIVRERRNG